MVKTGRVSISRVGVWSLAKVEGLLFTLLGILQSILLSFSDVTLNSTNLGAVAGFNLFGIFGFPIFYGLIGFISGGATAMIYNFVVKIIGGIELELE